MFSIRELKLAGFDYKVGYKVSVMSSPCPANHSYTLGSTHDVPTSTWASCWSSSLSCTAVISTTWRPASGWRMEGLTCPRRKCWKPWGVETGHLCSASKTQYNQVRLGFELMNKWRVAGLLKWSNRLHKVGWGGGGEQIDQTVGVLVLKYRCVVAIVSSIQHLV